MKRLVLSVFILAFVVSGLAVGVAVAVQQECVTDVSGVSGLLTQAQSAGDDASAAGLLGQARALLDSLTTRCVTSAAAMAGGDDASMATPSCLYFFDATVRSGPNAGANVRGQLVLVQDSDTTVSGLVVPMDGSSDGMIPMSGTLDGLTITMNFTMPDGATIVGTGPMDSSISDCVGVIEGTLVGPGEGDAGDWLGATRVNNRARCIQAGIRACIAQFGNQGSAACGADAAAACSVLYP